MGGRIMGRAILRLQRRPEFVRPARESSVVNRVVWCSLRVSATSSFAVVKSDEKPRTPLEKQQTHISPTTH